MLAGEFMSAAGVPAERLGAVLIAWADQPTSCQDYGQGSQNGVTDVRMLVEDISAWPHESQRAGLIVPAGILCTFTLRWPSPEAVAAVALKLNHRVEEVHQETERTSCTPAAACLVPLPDQRRGSIRMQ
jgi:hypothetical protein